MNKNDFASMIGLSHRELDKHEDRFMDSVGTLYEEVFESKTYNWPAVCEKFDSLPYLEVGAKGSGSSFEKLAFEDMDMSGEFLRGVHFTNVRFSNITFGWVVSCRFERCIFEDSSGTQSLLDHEFDECRFVNFEFNPCVSNQRIIFRNCSFENVKFDHLGGGHYFLFENCSIQNCSFLKSALGLSIFRNTIITDTDFRDSFLDWVRNEGSTVENCNFDGATYESDNNDLSARKLFLNGGEFGPPLFK